MFWPEILAESFHQPRCSSPSMVQVDPRTSRAARRHSPVATHLPKLRLQILELRHTVREAESCGPRQRIPYLLRKPAPFPCHGALAGLILALLKSRRALASESIARFHIPRQIPALRKLASPGEWHPALS